jgi:adenylyltransferase/sulfurtransferase
MSGQTPLNQHEKALYARQMRLPGVGESGQCRLRDAKVLILGVGGLGSPVALYLAAAGVGVLGLADPDKVEVSNLHRQIIHGFDTLGLPKTISAAESLSEINPGLKISLHPEGFTVENAADLVARYDLIIDGTDNFATRFLANDATVLGRKPLVHGSVLQSSGQVAVFLPGHGCYRCLYPVMPEASSVPTCAEAGVWGATCGVVGSWMAAEAIAILLGQRQQVRWQLLDLAAGTSKVVNFACDPGCPVCGKSPKITSLLPENYQSLICNTPMSDTPLEITIEEAARLLLSPQPPVLIDVREPDEYKVCQIAGSKLIPLATVPERTAEIPKDLPVLIHCHHGGRSLRATQFLRSKGYTQVSNVKGGIDAWSLKIDPKVPRY